MTEIDRIIRSRKSIYPPKFNGEKVAQKDLEQILQAAVYAPNHKKTEPWRFIVFREKAKAELGQKIAELYKEKTSPEKYKEKKHKSLKEKATLSDAVICIVCDLSGKVPEWEEVSATAMAVQNLHLKATELKIGGYWSSPRFVNYMADFLKLKENQKCMGFFFLGKVTPEQFEVRDYEWEKFVTFKD